MDRRRFLLTSLAGAVAAPLTAGAQQAAKVARIGYLADNPAPSPLRAAFLQGLRDLGYVEGRNLVIEYRYAEGKVERFPALAAELAALKVDVIFAAAAVLPAKQATSTVPVVFPAASDPVATGLVTSLARPGGNVTGLSFFTTELVGKCFELLKQAVPGSVGSLFSGSRVASVNARAAPSASSSSRPHPRRLTFARIRPTILACTAAASC